MMKIVMLLGNLMQQITLTEASHCLPNLIDAALSGEEIVITKDDRSAVKLVVMLLPEESIAKHGKRQRLFGSAKGLITMSDDFDAPLEDFKDYM
jgi:antitoxin (DNA-binding transcriptional repressor) of toxin-antitoxin stability system